MKYQKFQSSHRQNDRVYVEGRQVSVSRVYITEALQAQGREGATKADLLTLVGEEIGGTRPQVAIGQTVSAMLADGDIVQQDGRYWLKEHFPQPHANGNGSAPPVSPNGGNGKVAPFMGKRTGKTVSVYVSPRVFEDAIALSLKIDGEWFKLPLWGSARVCYGQEAPMWSPDQEMYTGVEEIKITLRNGQYVTEHPARTDIVTIAPE